MGITQLALKEKFVEKILTDEAAIIQREQVEVINDYGIETQSGALRDCLKGHFGIDSINGGPRLTMRYVKYLRLLEINPPGKGSLVREGMHLYNRIVFGRIYNDARGRIAWGYSDGLSEELMTQIKQAMEPIES